MRELIFTKETSMFYLIIKVFLSATVIVTVSEVAKRSSLLGGMIASLPLVSILAMTWIYIDTKDIDKISQLSTSILWLVIPSWTLLFTLPIFLKKGIGFYASLGLSALLTMIAYSLMLILLRKWDIVI
jgi:hypothetical protein